MRAPLLFTFSPLAVALAIFALREAGRHPPGPPPEPGVSIEMPMLRGSATPRRDLEYELDVERSSVRFLVTCNGDEHLFACSPTSIRGRLALAGAPSETRLELGFDLGGLRALESDRDGGSACDLWHVLGANKTAEVSYAATLVSSSTTPLACLQHKLWVGSLRFGGRVVRQPMGLWQTALPGQPLRLQGCGTVGAETYGLPRHSLFSLLHEHHTVTLGLDLAWRRRTGR